MSDRQRHESRRRLLAVPKQDDTPAGRSRTPVHADRVQTPTSSPERSGGGLLTLQSLVAFGVIAWAFGIVLAVSDTASRFSQASAIAVLLLLGCVAFLLLRPRRRQQAAQGGLPGGAGAARASGAAGG